MSDFKAKCTKFDFGWGSAPGPTAGGGGSQHSPHSLAGKGKKGNGRTLVIAPLQAYQPPQRRSGTWRAPTSVAHTCLYTFPTVAGTYLQTLKGREGADIKTVATRRQMLRLKCTKFDFSWGSDPDPPGSLQHSARQPSWWEGPDIKIVATRCQILRLKCTKFDFSWGSNPDPIGELTALPKRLSWWGGGLTDFKAKMHQIRFWLVLRPRPRCPSPKT